MNFLPFSLSAHEDLKKAFCTITCFRKPHSQKSIGLRFFLSVFGKILAAIHFSGRGEQIKEAEC